MKAGVLNDSTALQEKQQRRKNLKGIETHDLITVLVSYN